MDEGEQYDSFPPYWKELDPINKLARQQIGLKDPQEAISQFNFFEGRKCIITTAGQGRRRPPPPIPALW